MSLISFSPLQDGVTGVNAAATNTPLSTIYNDYNGNITDANISASAAIAGSKLAGNAVTADKLATNAITIGFAQITSTVTTTSNGTPVQATGLTVTVTIPSGGRKVEISVFVPRAQHNSAGNYFVGSIWDGTVGSGTQLVDSALYQATSANTGGGFYLTTVVTPAAGSKTYNFGFNGTSANTTSIAVSATSPAYILAKVI